MKKYIPSEVMYFMKYLRNRKICTNVNSDNNDKRALLSYITEPFILHDNLAHTNYREARTWAELLGELGYQVDVVQYNSGLHIDYYNYNIVCGFGPVVDKYFEAGCEHAQVVFYGTGMNPILSNQSTINRLRSLRESMGHTFSGSDRYVKEDCTRQVMLSDAIVALGNNLCAESYESYNPGRVFSLCPFYIKAQNVDNIIKNRSITASRDYLWFGSSGAVHKGLDLVLQFFSKNQHLNLHVCGPVSQERRFTEVFHEELFERKNIHYHGFLDISSDGFKNVLEKCAFAIFPSCSEGGSPSILTAIGNGALVPIISRQTTVSTGFEIWIEDLTEAGIRCAIEQSERLGAEDLRNMQLHNLRYVSDVFTWENYNNQLYAILRKIVLSDGDDSSEEMCGDK